MRKHQQEVDEWIKKIGKRYFSELTNLGQLSEEVGELARILIRQYGDQSWKKDEEPENIKTEIAEELSDIVFVVFCLANQLGIDMEEEFNKKMLFKTNRDFSRHQNNTKLD